MTMLLILLLTAPAGQPLSAAELEAKTQQVAALLRCPVCQGLSVADSPAEMAVNMKHQVREMLKQGYTEAQILESFEKSYGQFVLLKPKFQGMNVLVWILPLLAIAAGAFVVMRKVKQLENARRSSYLDHVRELVGGRS